MIWQIGLGAVAYLLLGVCFLAVVLHYSKLGKSGSRTASEFLFLLLWPGWIGLAALAGMFGLLIRLSRYLAGEAKA